MLFQTDERTDGRTDPGADSAAEQRANSSGLCEMKGERRDGGEEAVQWAKQKQNDNREFGFG